MHKRSNSTSAKPSSEEPSLPASFHITNRDQILKDLDKKLNSGKPPSVEYYFVEDTARSAHNPLAGFGHACVSYTLPDGTRKMMNIERGELIHEYSTPGDYVFGGTGDAEGKGGIFSRDFASIRVENVDAASILAMHHSFLSMQASSHAGVAQFDLSGGHFAQLFQMLWPFHAKAGIKGNCALWTSRSLHVAGLVSRYAPSANIQDSYIH
jgi:hypothetical protein